MAEWIFRGARRLASSSPPRLTHASALQVSVLAVSTLGVLTALGLALLPHARLDVVVCLFFVVVIVATLQGGRVPGIVAAVVAFVDLEYSFIPPAGIAANIAQPADWLVALIFLGTVWLVDRLSRDAEAQAEQARRRATEAEVLRRSDELKSTLLSLVGHDLQTPLTVIKTAATSLRDDPSLDVSPATDVLLGVIDQEADRLHYMVTNLLDLSRIEDGALRLALEWYDLGELARESVGRLRSLLNRQAVVIHAADDLPPIRVDYVLLDRVIANLVLNAVRHAPMDEPILVEVKAARGAIRLSVSDHGPGVPAADRERIFERFYRREGPWAGAGLGLALCKAIVEAHGGEIHVEPLESGQNGLRVVVTLVTHATPKPVVEDPSDGRATLIPDSGDVRGEGG